MPQTLTWGAGGDQAYQDYRANEQAMQMNALTMKKEQTILDDKARQDQLDAQAAQLFSTANSGNIPPDMDNFSQDTGKDPDRADAMFEAGDLYARNGAMKAASDMWTAGREMRKAEADDKKNEFDTKLARANVELKQTDIVGRYLGSATDESSWNRGVQALEDSGLFEPQEIEQIKAIPYSPEAAAEFVATSMSARERIIVETNKATQDRIANTAAANQENARRLTDLAVIKVNETKRMNDLKEKNGSTAVTAPTTAEIKAAEAAVGAQIFGGATPAIPLKGKSNPQYVLYQSLVQEVASRAKELVRTNRGMDMNTAMQRAITEAMTTGDWSMVADKTWWGGDAGKHVEVRGRSPDLPMALPPKPDPARLKKNHYYTTPKGVLKWNGTSFED